MKYSYLSIIKRYTTEAKKIPGIYDLLVRGSLALASEGEDTKKFVKNWSDLDLSIIVNKLTPEVYKVHRDIYQKIKQKTKIKISVILVDTKDFFSQYHCHGIRPMYYSQILKRSKSLLRPQRELNHNSIQLCFNRTAQVSCFSNIVYLVHDLRNGYTNCPSDLENLQLFCRHLVKRTKHIIRNAIFIRTGYIDEDICDKLLSKYYPDVDKKITKKIVSIKIHWERISNDVTELQSIVRYMFTNIDIIYLSVMSFVNLCFSDDNCEQKKAKKPKRIELMLPCE